MRLYINDKNSLLGNTAVSRIESRTRLAFDKFRNDVRAIVITVEDINGPRGGIDRVCKVLVKLRSRKELFVSDKNSSVSSVVSSAIDRVTRAVRKTVDRRTNRTRTRVA